MKVVVLGSGGYYTNEERHTACYMIPELGIIFDCGNGIFRAPKHVETETVYILITHAHLDHVEGVRMCGQIVGDKCKRLIIYGIPEVISVIKSFFNQPFTWDGAKYNFELRIVNANETFTFDILV